MIRFSKGPIHLKINEMNYDDRYKQNNPLVLENNMMRHKRLDPLGM